METTRRVKNSKKSLFEIGYKYLCYNFHKFNTQQKIKIALEIVKAEYQRGTEQQEEMPPVVINITNEPVATVVVEPKAESV